MHILTGQESRIYFYVFETIQYLMTTLYLIVRTIRIPWDMQFSQMHSLNLNTHLHMKNTVYMIRAVFALIPERKSMIPPVDGMLLEYSTWNLERKRSIHLHFFFQHESTGWKAGFSPCSMHRSPWWTFVSGWLPYSLLAPQDVPAIVRGSKNWSLNFKNCLELF